VSTRIFTIAGQCGIPPGATAASLNVTVTEPTAPGHLSLFPADKPQPLVSAINYKPSQARANNAVVSLGAAGDLAVYNRPLFSRVVSDSPHGTRRQLFRRSRSTTEHDSGRMDM
jgi:hypothetical protein